MSRAPVAMAVRPRALLVCFDFKTWAKARMWSYASGLMLYHDAQDRFDCELQILVHGSSEARNAMIIDAATRDRSFDVIVVWLPHATLSRKILRTLSARCGRLILLLVESLLYTRQEIREQPYLKGRLKEVKSLLVPGSHILCLCPTTFRLLKERGFDASLSFGFWPQELPSGTSHGEKSRTYAFAASMYNEARRVAAAEMGRIEAELGLTRLEISDDTRLIDRFDRLMVELEARDGQIKDRGSEERSLICSQIADTRRALWRDYLRKVSRADFIVTLPSYFKGTPGRVIEALCCGVPVIFLETNLPPQDVRSLQGIRGLHFARIGELGTTVAELLGSRALSESEEAKTGAKEFPSIGDNLQAICVDGPGEVRGGVFRALQGFVPWGGG